MTAFTTAPMSAPAATPATISGTVRTTDGAPVGSAGVVLQGPTRMTTTSDASGAFTFANVTPGAYTLIVSKAGFQRYEDDNLVALDGQRTTVDVALAEATFSTLRTIASVSTTARGHVTLNTSSAAVSSISDQVFAQQGQTQVTKILNETPGIISGASPENGNGASEGSFQNIQIRGALPYETEQLIDGHPTTLSLGGTYNPIYLNPALLQRVEVVKGPGSMPEEINYAIGGTVNYITLQPTRTPEASATIGYDNWGGVTTAFKATGSIPSHKLDYAFGYATNGAPGPLRNYPITGSQLYLIAGAPPWTLNGQQIAQIPQAYGPYPPSSNLTGIGGVQFNDPMYVCCWNINTAFYSRGQLAKIRANFSQATSLTLSYLGGQAFNDEGGMDLTSLCPIGTTPGCFSIFTPPAGYNGSVPAGASIPFDLTAFLPQYQSVQQNLYQAEFRTSVGPFSVLARYFTAADRDFDYIQTAANGSYSFGGAAWGGMLVCPKGDTWDIVTYETTGVNQCLPPSGAPVSPSMQYFNGQKATFETQGAINNGLEQDHLRGQSILFERPYENGDDFAFSVDQAHHDSTSFSEIQTVGPGFYSLPPGASQNFLTFMARGHFFVAPRLFVGLANYVALYGSHFTDDGGTTWHDATRSYDSPRVGLTWRPNVDTVWRLATGSSVAPPELGLLSSAGTTPLPNINGAPTYYVQDLNNGNIAPETAWGYDLGVDHRLDTSTMFSVDLYDETLRNEFLSSTTLKGTYKGLPLYASETANLGHAKYQGVEFQLQRAPAVGWGYTLQGSLQRAYAYDLPTDFYCSVPGPGCTQDTNLGILPNVNFGAGGLGFNTLNGTAVPYSMGYAEINKRTAYGTYYLMGTTYYGPNNTFSRPPFFIFNAAIREPVGTQTALQLSVDNIFDTYGNSWTNYFGGIPTALAVGGVLGPTVAGNYGPTSFRLELSHQFGNGQQ
ncbi:MAG TPA: TonB-dependent receptor [Candidatus Baltobacteraceae bacterium]|nr:TonB-dependent receptor [Candidatus Baltobacteraceae bacterium]